MAFKKQKKWSDSAYNDHHLLIPGWISWRKWMSGLLNMYCANADVHKTDKSNIAVVLQKCRMPTFSSSDGAAHAADLPPGVPLQRHLNCLTMSGERGLLLRESCTKRRQISSLPRIKRRRAAAESKHECRVQFTDEALLDFWASPFKVFLTEISSVPFEATGMWSNSGEESPAGVCGVFLQSRCFVCAGPAARWLWVLLSSSLISEGRCSLSRRQNRPASNPSVKTGLHSQMSICIPNHASLAVWKDKNRRIIFNEARGEN